MTPVFFNAGDLCAGVFSEDESWYRARVVGTLEERYVFYLFDMAGLCMLYLQLFNIAC